MDSISDIHLLLGRIRSRPQLRRLDNLKHFSLLVNYYLFKYTSYIYVPIANKIVDTKLYEHFLPLCITQPYEECYLTKAH